MDKDIKKLGEIIKAVRKEQGLTQHQLAAASGVGIRFLRELENGKSSCQISLVFKVISMLGLVIKIGEHEL